MSRRRRSETRCTRRTLRPDVVAIPTKDVVARALFTTAPRRPRPHGDADARPGEALERRWRADASIVQGSGAASTRVAERGIGWDRCG
jgi:hypothetical protein